MYFHIIQTANIFGNFFIYEKLFNSFSLKRVTKKLNGLKYLLLLLILLLTYSEDSAVIKTPIKTFITNLMSFVGYSLSHLIALPCIQQIVYDMIL